MHVFMHARRERRGTGIQDLCKDFGQIEGLSRFYPPPPR